MCGVQLWWNYKKPTLNRLHIAYRNILVVYWYIKYMTIPACYTLCLMYNAVSQILEIWCIDLCVDLIALLTIF